MSLIISSSHVNLAKQSGFCCLQQAVETWFEDTVVPSERQRSGALHDLAERRGGPLGAPASWTAEALCRFLLIGRLQIAAHSGSSKKRMIRREAVERRVLSASQKHW